MPKHVFYMALQEVFDHGFHVSFYGQMTLFDHGQNVWLNMVKMFN
jgi:hypothetical protein